MSVVLDPSLMQALTVDTSITWMGSVCADFTWAPTDASTEPEDTE